ncbi:MAG: ABC transporter permease [Acidobacteriota bacterium]|nr:ABC transporter permease [Acidobacteriota bacterium]
MSLRSWFLFPARVWMALFFAAPMAIVCAYAFLTRGDFGGVGQPWNSESFTRLADPLYAAVLWRSVWIALAATAACAVLGFPLALFIARAGRRRNLYLQLVLLPFWTSFLVRTYAWLFILRETGLVNTILMRLHIIRTPLQLLYNDGAVLLGLVYNFLPFFVLPLYAVLEKMDLSLLEAAADLGARPRNVFWRVIVPLASPGIAAGSVLVFIPCLGAYLTPDLLGGGKSIMLGNLIQNQFTTSRDWPFGSAASIILMLTGVLLLSALLRSRAARELL